MRNVVKAAIKRNQLGFIMQMVRSQERQSWRSRAGSEVQGLTPWRLGLRGERLRGHLWRELMSVLGAA